MTTLWQHEDTGMLTRSKKKPSKRWYAVQKNICEGIQVSGHWKGHPCCNNAKHKTEDGRGYCHIHYAIALTDPERFEKVKAYLLKREKLSNKTIN